MVTRELGFVKEIIEDLGLELSHAYDDLVFVNNNVFLLQFDEKPNSLKLHFNVDCNEADAKTIEQNLTKSATAHNMKIQNAGKYSLQPNEETEELRLEFFPK